MHYTHYNTHYITYYTTLYTTLCIHSHSHLLGDVSSDVVEFLQKLKEGVQDLFTALPPTSHLRQPLLHYIAQYLPISQASDWFHVSRSTVKSARKLPESKINAGLLKVERFVADEE